MRDTVHRSLKRVVLSPRAYLLPYMIVLFLHHLPIILAFATLNRPDGFASCENLENLFQWLDVSFALHVAIVALVLTSLTATLYMRVYRSWYPEIYVILLLVVLYTANLVWAIYGTALPTYTNQCFLVLIDHEDRDRARKAYNAAQSISGFLDFDLIWTILTLSLLVLTSYCCGVHTSDSFNKAEERWKRRCLWAFYLFTCQRSSKVNNETGSVDYDVFKSLGTMLGRFLVLRYSDNEFVGFSCNDFLFTLNLVAKSQRQERLDQIYPEPIPTNPRSPQMDPTNRILSADESPEDDLDRAQRISNASRPEEYQLPPYTKGFRFHPSIEESRLRDIARYGKFAIGIYGWPMYCLYNPLQWFKLLQCRRTPKQQFNTFVSQVIENDNVIQANRGSFVQYTGIPDSKLIYLNCHNFVFRSPYAIVKDTERREFIISIRGSLSFHDFLTNGLAEIICMDSKELPADVPNPSTTMTHFGMLQAARKICQGLQTGQQKVLFWDFAMKYCGYQNENLQAIDESRNEREWDSWRIVICGHSMGAGVAGILALVLKRYFPRNVKAFLYAPPMLLDSATAEWSKQFITTCIYGDDLVPRLSIASFIRLEQEMHFHYHHVAHERLFRVKFSKKYKLVKYPKAIDQKKKDRRQRAQSIQASVERKSFEPLPRFNPRHFFHGSRTSLLDSQSSIDGTCISADDCYSVVRLSVTESKTEEVKARHPAAGKIKDQLNPTETEVSTKEEEQNGKSPRSASNTSPEVVMDDISTSDVPCTRTPWGKLMPFFAISNDVEKTPLPEVDVPGEIVHVRTRAHARRCRCVVFRGEERIEYKIVDASAFRRIWVTPHAVQDHMFHHYDSTLTRLVKTYTGSTHTSLSSSQTSHSIQAQNEIINSWWSMTEHELLEDRSPIPFNEMRDQERDSFDRPVHIV
uniref:sn-1-specific diacylglycerol lipase n=1 Tax=Albugo laibachii Nc14 TaxID=890382 RepID=F0WIY9_9STRA|nr:conserved hypothetical protein [Albugo laibachii Nc14]|eukprot:CCA21235.1 conserved hypothetical protein [Albugo laibachii Nc14]